MSAETVKRKQGGGRRPLLPYEQARRARSWLKQARESAGLSAAALGQLVDASPGWIKGRESGGTWLTQAEVAEIAAALRVPVPDLTGGA